MVCEHRTKINNDYVGKRPRSLGIMDKRKQGRMKPRWDDVVIDILREKVWDIEKDQDRGGREEE